MAGRAILITNNPSFPYRVPAGVDVLLLDGGARDALTTARDRVHQGWRLANHPLYGNFRPHQQPYRSLLLLPPSPSGTVDSDSLHFLEQALQLYQSPSAKVRQSLPGDLARGHAPRLRSAGPRIAESHAGKPGTDSSQPGRSVRACRDADGCGRFPLHHHHHGFIRAARPKTSDPRSLS